MRKLTFVFMFAAVISIAACPVWCQTIVDMNAEIESENTLTVSINKVVGTTWSSATAIDFGVLTFDSTNKIFTADNYYAVEVGVNSNATNWTVTHAINKSVVHETDTAKNLNDNINVTFVKRHNTNPEVQLGKYSLTNANNKAYTKTDIGVASGYWLRIYYGIATGSGDGTGAVPITTDKPSGKYSGQIKLTLTAS